MILQPRKIIKDKKKEKVNMYISVYIDTYSELICH